MRKCYFAVAGGVARERILDLSPADRVVPPLGSSPGFSGITCDEYEELIEMS